MRARVYMELKRYEEAMCDCVEAGALDPGETSGRFQPSDLESGLESDESPA